MPSPIHQRRYTAVVTAVYEVEVPADDPLSVPALAMARIRTINPTDASVTQIRDVSVLAETAPEEGP